VAALAAVGSASMLPVSRRRLLRAAVFGVPAIALASSVGVGVVADRVVADELAGYDKIDSLLERIGGTAVNRRERTGAAGTRPDPSGES
jgi:hypothetical protein